MAKLKTLRQLSLIRLLFGVGLVVLIIPIWQNKYFITGDGPSHLYNSKVLLDLLVGNSSEFYLTYYELNNAPEPNWFSHILYMLLLSIFPAFLAEKILLTAYILCFAFGLRKLIITINPKAEWLSILGLTLVYQRIFFMGFYNCVISYAIAFYILAYWIKHRQELSPTKILILSFALIVIYFTHIFGFLFVLFTITIIYLFDFISNRTLSVSSRLKQGLYLLIASIPSLLLVFWYLHQPAGPISEHSTSNKVLYHQLIEANFLMNLSKSEKGYAIAIAIVFGLALVFFIISKIRNKHFNWIDVFGILFILLVIIYFNLPGYLAGGAFFVERLQFLIYLSFLLWLASINYSEKISLSFSVLSLLVGSVLIIKRIPQQYKMSEYVEELASVSGEIEEESTLLALSYNHCGCDINGEFLSNNLWLFIHAADYVALDKPIVILSNYEANTGYFPLIYKADKNPFHHLGNIEGQPPATNIQNYQAISGEQIDYILLTCFEKNMQQNESVKGTFQTLHEKYTCVYKSEYGRAILFEHL